MKKGMEGGGRGEKEDAERKSLSIKMLLQYPQKFWKVSSVNCCDASEAL